MALCEAESRFRQHDGPLPGSISSCAALLRPVKPWYCDECWDEWGAHAWPRTAARGERGAKDCECAREYCEGCAQRHGNFSNTLDWNRWTLWEEAKPFA